MIIRLDDRLSIVAEQIRSRVHADIGSDHGKLLAALLASGRIDQGIAIENKTAPYENSRRALSDYDADVRFADGLAGLRPAEAESLSLCGMGGNTIVRILAEYPDRIPDLLVLQANDHVAQVRRWAFESRFHLADEFLVPGDQGYVVTRFRRASCRSPQNATLPEVDEAYSGLDLELGFEFGPHLIRRWEPDFVKRITDEQAYWMNLPRLDKKSKHRLEMINRLLQDKALGPSTTDRSSTAGNPFAS